MKLAALTLTSVLLLAPLLTISAAQAETPFSKERQEWNVPQKPFHIIGNLYYVGMAGVSAFLIKTDDGLILTDGGLPESAPFIEKNIQALGFKLKDVKLLLNSHAHFDHSGGLPQLKKDTGAKLAAGAADKPFLESGHITFGPSSKIDTTPVHVDQAVKDGDKVSLGNVTLTAHATPGHTKGCTTWTMPLTDSGKTYKVMFFCSISVAGNPLVNDAAYPNIQADYRASFAKLNAMQADIFLAPHGGQFDLDAKLAKMKPGAPNPFIDPGELHRFLAKARADYDAELAKQVAAAKKP
jgi:metallo-beta-lactamase class B